MKNREAIIVFLNRKVEEYNRQAFIADDPIAVPHRYQRLQDIEIAGFFSAIFAWGNRKTIIQKALTLLELMGESPYEFLVNHQEADRVRFLNFSHRTFNATDLLYFVEFLQQHYRREKSLETAFLKGHHPGDPDITGALNGFHRYFFSLEEYPPRTLKHIAAPWKGSTCKRLNMFLRWMVRKDGNGVDFGCWKGIGMHQLIIPLDVHVARVSQRLGLLERESVDWKAAQELTAWLRTLDADDPVKYDFALFALGIVEKF
ncbi:TIGR02757 family protein [Flavihumibacter petaseus]|uniref:TIGR02757 family protein n=1 Tax=Flavihumibacter petaseus NBRC 106054 TaxID=1220578 RepID=A0A0E9MZ85_9BACT|nr:TIGR02757 family protein [Flavihumibacter petaseus]GAO42405.1 hypothetical protein FPE01S_01_14200 [Flavihumibacter petaseus NBRC 106054]